MTPRVLIVDDEARMAHVIAMALRHGGFDCETCTSAAAALESLESRPTDAVVTDRKMPGTDGLELLERIRRRWPDLPVILLTAHADVPSAVQAMQLGAFDYITKPFDNEELRAIVGRACEMRRLERENRWLRQEITERFSPDCVVAESETSRRLLDLVRRIAPSRIPVLVQGESGTGKELIARLLHYWSNRIGEPFVAVNCKAFAESLLESELFGHEKGAFTGATHERAGCFERAHGGTLFLDEIGEVSLSFQGKLLRVLQEGEVLRVGGRETRRVDVRVVAATNRVLTDEVAAGRFREDLYFRLNGICLDVPPLRKRREDVLPLAQRFLSRASAEAGRKLTLSTDAKATLRRHSWPGNVRELENAIERAVVLARDETIDPEDLLLEEPRSRADGDDGTLQETLDRAASERVRAVLRETRGNRTEAAHRLGIERTTLYRMMKRFEIE